MSSFNRIAALLTFILKTIVPPKKLIFKWLEIDTNKVNRFEIGSGEKIARKLRKLKSQNLLKSQKLA